MIIGQTSHHRHSVIDKPKSSTAEDEKIPKSKIAEDIKSHHRP
jgi:hypothetical protein